MWHVSNVHITQYWARLCNHGCCRNNSNYRIMKCACAILSSVACPALQYLSTLSHKRHDFQQKKTLFNIKCAFRISLQISPETFLILRTTEGDRSKMYNVLRIKYPLFLSDFNEAWIFSTDFRKVLKYQISWKSVQWEPSCSVLTSWRTARQTDRHDKANSRFSQIF